MLQDRRKDVRFMSDTPETDEIEKHDGITIRDSVTTCGDESSSVYINVIHARQLERERDEARNTIVGWENKWKCAVDMAARAEIERDDAQRDARLLSERLTALELESTAELARLEQELINMKELYESNN